MTSVAIYIRLSDEDRNKTSKEQDSESIINQRNILSEFVNERGWKIYDIYSDDDFSGSDSLRPEFNRMINDARDRKFQVVLCKSLSRFARDVSVVETYVNGYFIEWGIRYMSISDHADTSQKGNRKNIQINSLVNQWYIEDLSENIKSVMTFKKKQGQFVGSFAPYGYIKDPDDNHKLIVDEEAASVVAKIFKMYLDGHGFKAIAVQLNREGIPCPSKYRIIKGIKTNRADDKAHDYNWSDHTVWHITGNPNYTGDLVQCRYGKPTYKSKSVKAKPAEEWVIVQNTHEAIISKADYERVQQIKKSKGRYNRKSSNSVNAFAGLVKCKICERSLVLSAGYFRCTGRKSGISGCNCAMVKQDLLTALITDEIKGVFDEYCDYNALEKRTGKKKSHYEFEINALQKQSVMLSKDIQKIETALTQSYIDKTSGDISDDEYSVISNNIKIKKDELIETLDSIQSQKVKYEELKAGEHNKSHIIEKYKNFSELNRELLNSVIERIYIGERTDKVQKEIGTDGRKAQPNFYLEIIYKI